MGRTFDVEKQEKLMKSLKSILTKVGPDRNYLLASRLFNVTVRPVTVTAQLTTRKVALVAPPPNVEFFAAIYQ